MVHSNSIQAYDVAKPGIKSNKQLILECIKSNPGKTALWIASKLNKEIHKISGRFGEMRDAGLIMEIGEVKIGRTKHALWAIKTELKQLTIF